MSTVSTAGNSHSAKILTYDRWHKSKSIGATQIIVDLINETGLDFDDARLLGYHRGLFGEPCDARLYSHECLRAEAIEERLAKQYAERALPDPERGNGADQSYIDWDALDRKRHDANGGAARQFKGGLAQEAPSEPGKLDEWDAGDEPGAIPPRQWLLGNQFCRGFISSIVAAGGTGKSALRLLQFISLALGRPLCGQHVFRRGRVLLISLEDDRDELQRRIKAVLDYYGIDRSELKGWLFCASPKLAKLAEMKNRTRAIGPLEQQVRDAIKRRNPDLISLDPFIKTHSLEENDNADMDFVCDLLARMAIEFNIGVDSPHHVHKGTLTPGDADSGRGASGIKDAGRLVYTLTPMSEADAKIFNIDPETRFSYVRLDSAKVNLAVRSGHAEWFHIVGQNIGNGTEEYPNGDTIQVVEPWSPPSTWADTTTEGLNAILDDIARGMTDDDGNPTGQRYTNAPRSPKRAVWPVVQKHYPDKPEGACREIIHAWLTTGLLYPDDYDDPVDRRERKGLFVADAKRPGASSP